MKRFMSVMAVVAMVAVIVSCASGAKPSGAGGASGKGSAGKNKDADEDASAFDKVYMQAHEKLSEDGAQTYTVQSGDTLTAITKQFYGDDKGYYFPMIMAASSDVVTNPDLIVPGMELTVPDYDANMGNDKIRGALKGVFKKVASIYSKQGKDEMKDHLLEVADSL